MAQKCTNINPEEEEGKTQLATTYVGQSSDDIRRKLQKAQEQEEAGERYLKALGSSKLINRKPKQIMALTSISFFISYAKQKGQSKCILKIIKELQTNDVKIHFNCGIKHPKEKII
ncbi:hypothetical protein Nmel_008451 [Mimus melanotis]